MKTLENQTLLYDEDCPLCQAYTTGFIKIGMLDQNGKKPFTDISQNELDFIDIKRAANEIALIDTKNKTAIYGIESLLKVIGNSFPLLETIGKINPINFILRKLYSFISYNRKVIIPSQYTPNSKLNCEPTFSFKYRILYLLFAITITILALYHCSKMIPMLPKSSYLRECILATGQLIFQSIFLLKKDKKTILIYLGNVMTVSLLGSLLLLPVILLNKIILVNKYIVLVWFGLTVLLMLKEHYRRVNLLNLPKYLSLTWVLYRIIALFIILNL
ncbi:DCC1-like thiol-disulfide oxidoreductase family protein [Flavobacterium sp.]|uniref:DCC1-like thiol-disulfide oxidoreductase family protein n=1 Tax=Flavobacterium sp. TaxID=239 RepID=UPI003D6B32D2